MPHCNTCRPLLILLSTVAELGEDFAEAGFTGLFFSRHRGRLAGCGFPAANERGPEVLRTPPTR